MMTLKQIISLIAVIAFLSVSNLFAESEKDTTGYPPAEDYKTFIGGHPFSLNSSIDDPFIIPSLRINLGTAQTISPDIMIPIDNDFLQDTLYTKSEMTYLMGAIKYKHKINDWAALSFGMSAMGRISSSFATLFFRGISTITGFSLKWHFKTLETKKSILTASLAMNNYSFYYFNIKDYIEDVIDTNNTIPASIDQTYISLNTELGLSYALGCTEFFGLMAVGHIGYGELPSRNFQNGFYGDLTIYFDFNLIPLFDVPLGLSLGIAGDTFPFEIDDPEDLSRAVSFKISYNGNDSFNLGLESSYLNIPELSEYSTNQIIKAAFVFEFFF
jgi:hypothetical protein